jgi:16S rRNA (adenine1518-N6/adenine1519-N6)-dimethyltransferase
MNEENINKFNKILPLKQWVEKFGLIANKSFGQNFLFDLNVTDKIVKLAGLKPTDSVLEVGPGLGPLTMSLLKTNIKKLEVIEMDTRFKVLLEEIKNIDDRLIINFGDCLKFEIPSYINKIVANLPYNISVVFIMEVLEKYPQIEEMTVLIQKEVGDRFVSGNNSKIFGTISLLSQIYSHVEILYKLPPKIFVPAPKVDSTLVKFTRKNNHLLENFPIYKDLIRVAFSERRKLLTSTLGKKYPILKPFLLNKRCENLTVNNISEYGEILKNNI